MASLRDIPANTPSESHVVKCLNETINPLSEFRLLHGGRIQRLDLVKSSVEKPSQGFSLRSSAVKLDFKFFLFFISHTCKSSGVYPWL